MLFLVSRYTNISSFIEFYPFLFRPYRFCLLFLPLCSVSCLQHCRIKVTRAWVSLLVSNFKEKPLECSPSSGVFAVGFRCGWETICQLNEVFFSCVCHDLKFTALAMTLVIVFWAHRTCPRWIENCVCGWLKPTSLLTMFLRHWVGVSSPSRVTGLHQRHRAQSFTGLTVPRLLPFRPPTSFYFTYDFWDMRCMVVLFYPVTAWMPFSVNHLILLHLTQLAIHSGLITRSHECLSALCSLSFVSGFLLYW